MIKISKAKVAFFRKFLVSIEGAFVITLLVMLVAGFWGNYLFTPSWIGYTILNFFIYILGVRFFQHFGLRDGCMLIATFPFRCLIWMYQKVHVRLENKYAHTPGRVKFFAFLDRNVRIRVVINR